MTLLLFCIALFPARLAYAAGGSITGTVTNNADSSPIGGVYVDAYDSNWNYVTSGYTDASGNYNITDLASGNYYLQTYNTLGFISRYYNNASIRATASAVVVSSGMITPGINFIMSSGAGSISGRITRSSDGRGMSNVNVIAYQSTDWSGLYIASVYTDFRGRYFMPGLPSGSFFIKTVGANNSGYIDEYYDNVTVSGGAVSVNVDSGADTAGINIALDLGGIISGRVTRASDGAGIPNEGVLLWTDPINAFANQISTTADSNGYYRFTGLKAGYYIPRAGGSGYAPQMYEENLYYMGAPVHVSLGAEISNINFALQPSGSISGRITRDSDDTGIQSGLSVIAWNANQFGGGFGTVDASGNYTVSDLSPGYYYIQASAPGYAGEYYTNAKDQRAATVVAVKASANTPNINLSLASVPVGSISGTVVRDSDSAALNYVPVRAYNTNWTQAGSINTGGDNTGAYKITNLPVGNYYIGTFGASNFADVYYGNSTSRAGAMLVTVTQDAETTNINLRMAATGRAISGRVTRTSDGTGIYNVPLQVYDADWFPVRTGSSSYSGNYSIPGLMPGSYYVATNNVPSYIEQYYNNSPTSGGATLVVVPADANATGIDFALAAGGSIVGAVVNDFDATGIQGIVVHAYDAGWSEVASAVTDATGNYRVEGLTAGATYYLKTSNNLGYIDRYCFDTALQSKAAKIILMTDRAYVQIRLKKQSTPLTDFTNDLKTDMAVWRPSTGVWYVRNSNGSGSYTATQWGMNSDKPVAADYDGDGKADLAVWRPSNTVWYILPSASPGSYTSVPWGATTDIPVPADYDGDKKTDIAVWRPSTGTWYIKLSTTNGGSYRTAQWGSLNDIPVAADYDGDGKTDLAFWRPATQDWYVLPSEAPGTYTITHWGSSPDKPVPGDYDRDGRADVAIWQSNTGVWYVLPSNSPGSYTSRLWGMAGDIPVPGDYDADGKMDMAVWRPSSGGWYILPSASPGSYISIQWGSSGDVPVSAITTMLNSMP